MFLNKFDFISPNITLYYKERKRHLSPLGGLLTFVLAVGLISLIMNYTHFDDSHNSSSLKMYRNYEIDKSYNYFNESGLFHFIWIYNNENLMYNNEIQLNSFKKGIIRIYMTYVYDKYEYNSSNLRDHDHWVYDTCHSYVDKNDLKYDYSYSSCIKYYYNSIDKKYYSIHDNANFKWPYMREDITDNKNKTSFATFIEKCSNNSVINEILGECYTGEKINEYLSVFNKIFISFIDNKIQINDKRNRITPYSYKIYDNIINNGKSFYTHELKFYQFNYEEQKNIISKKYIYNSFMFDGERPSLIRKNEDSKLLLVYVFNIKNYINEFKKHENFLFDFCHRIGGIFAIVYYFFYIFNFFVSERLEVRNFQKFLNDKGGNMVQRHINYEKNKIYTVKSNINTTNISNELNDQYRTFKSTYMGNLKIDSTNINNTINNTRAIDNKYATTNVEKTKIEEKDNAKKSENIIIINNGTFMNEGASNNSKINLNLANTIGKLESMKLLNKRNELEVIDGYNKTYTYTKKQEGSQDIVFPSFKDKSEMNPNNFINYSKNKNYEFLNLEKEDNIEYNSKQKILDASSISLLNLINKNKNIFNNNQNYIQSPKKEKEMPILNFDKNSELLSPKISPKPFSKNNPRNTYKDGSSQNDNFFMFNPKSVLQKKNHRKYINYNMATTAENLKQRRQSYQQRNTLRKKYEKDNDSEMYKANNGKNRRRTGVFNSPVNRLRERRLSLFSCNTNNNNNIDENNRLFSVYPCDYHSQNNFSRNLIEHYKKIGMYKFKDKKNEKEIISPSSVSKNQKKDNKSLLKYENSNKNNKFQIILNIKWTPRILWDYLCLCRTKKKNAINILNKFRHKLLSEEYLYILHLNMFIFKQKLGCKSGMEKNNLLEELYNDI